ncbi:Transforming acidic coiled-coil-containing protein 2 [Plecturocebus cupreus]
MLRTFLALVPLDVGPNPDSVLRPHERRGCMSECVQSPSHNTWQTEVLTMESFAHSGWSGVVQSWFIATPASWVQTQSFAMLARLVLNSWAQVIHPPQLPKVLGLWLSRKDELFSIVTKKHRCACPEEPGEPTFQSTAGVCGPLTRKNAEGSSEEDVLCVPHVMVSVLWLLTVAIWVMPSLELATKMQISENSILLIYDRLCFSFQNRSQQISPVADDVIQPIVLTDLENPSLAASSHHGDVVGQVSTDLTAQRYAGGPGAGELMTQWPFL